MYTIYKCGLRLLLLLLLKLQLLTITTTTTQHCYTAPMSNDLYYTMSIICSQFVELTCLDRLK